MCIFSKGLGHTTYCFKIGYQILNRYYYKIDMSIVYIKVHPLLNMYGPLHQRIICKFIFNKTLLCSRQ